MKLYIFENPKTQIERDHNKETKMLAENVRAQRQFAFQAGSYGFIISRNNKKNFIEHFKKILNAKKAKSDGDYYFWHSIYKHLIEFRGEAILFGDLTEGFCRQFKEYLENSDQIWARFTKKLPRCRQTK